MKKTFIATALLVGTLDITYAIAFGARRAVLETGSTRGRYTARV